MDRRDPLPPFVNRLPDDTFWAARQVMAFTDEEIRAIVQTGQYSKPAEDWITATLIERRNRIGRTYFGRVLPLDRIRVEGNTLAFDDLGVSNGFARRALTRSPGTSSTTPGTRVLEAIGTGADVPDAARALPAGSYAGGTHLRRLPGHERHRLSAQAGRRFSRSLGLTGRGPARMS